MQLGLESVNHDATAFAERFTRTPQIVPADAVENSVHTITGEAVDFLHEVRIAVVDRSRAKLLNYLCRLRRTRSEHLKASELPKLKERSANTA
jgi:hypothetical protein